MSLKQLSAHILQYGHVIKSHMDWQSTNVCTEATVRPETDKERKPEKEEIICDEPQNVVCKSEAFVRSAFHTTSFWNFVLAKRL